MKAPPVESSNTEECWMRRTRSMQLSCSHSVGNWEASETTWPSARCAPLLSAHLHLQFEFGNIRRGWDGVRDQANVEEMRTEGEHVAECERAQRCSRKASRKTRRWQMLIIVSLRLLRPSPRSQMYIRRKVNINWTRVAVPQGACWPH